MLVEDDNNLREIYEARLMAEGYEIVSARDGEEALAVAVRERPDLIISDVMMPKISGFDMLDILRSTPETKNTKVIMMTALSQAEDKARAEKLGADRYLVKSQVTLEDVAKVAREVLAGDTGIGAVAADVPTPPPVATPAPAADPTPELVVSQVVPVATPDPVLPVATPVTASPVTAAPTTDEPAQFVDPAPAADAATADLVSAANAQASPAAGVTDIVEAPTPATQAAAPVIAPAQADIEKTSAELWAAPTETVDTYSIPAVTTETSAAEAKVNAAPSQNLADEEAAIAKQIESFIDKPVAAPIDPVTPAVEAPASEPALATPDPLPTPAAPAPPPVPEVAAPAAAEPAATSAPTDSPSPRTGGEKVIQPISNPSAPASPSLDELVAKEAAKTQTTGNVIEPQAPPAGGVDPNSLAL